MGCRGILAGLTKWRKLIIAGMVPILAAPLPICIEGQESKCAYSLIIIAVYWITEVIPLAVTSLLPMVLFPLFGIMKASDVSMSYFKETLMLFLGSLIVAVAVEKWNLHKRLALRTLTLVGPQPKWLLLGVIFPTWFLSMWMSNTATAAMMMPIVSAILLQINACQDQDTNEHDMLMDSNGARDGKMYETTKQAEESKDVEKAPPSNSSREKETEFNAFAKTFSLVTAYSANIGGIATLTGTPPNVIFKGLADGIYRNASAENPVNFANWLGVGLPLSFVLVILLWVWMVIHMEGIGCLKFWKKDTTNYERVRESLHQEYRKLGKMQFAETVVAVLFVILACLWITRKPGFIYGWGDLFQDKYIGDSTPAILIAVLLFILPAHPPQWLVGSNSNGSGMGDNPSKDSKREYQPLLDWKTVHQQLSWGVLLLMGGGFALARGCEVSGLSAWVSSNLDGLSGLPTWVIVLVLSIMIALATEVTSNAATTTLFIPIVGNTAIRMGINPLVFMIPCTIASSLAFLLPVATPPNAIVFAAGYLNIKDMVLCGIPMNILSILTLNIMMNTWAIPVYNLNVLDEAFINTNLTANSTVPLSMMSTGIDGNATLNSAIAFFPVK